MLLDAYRQVFKPIQPPENVRPRMREIAEELKHRDGESWSVGEFLERAALLVDVQEGMKGSGVSEDVLGDAMAAVDAAVEKEVPRG